MMPLLLSVLDGGAALAAMIITCGMCGIGGFFLKRRNPQMAALMVRGGLLFSFILCSMAFLDLVRHFVVSDFSYRVVAAHSHTSAGLLYKIGAVWAHHEGSLLLWLWVMALYGAAFSVVRAQIFTGIVHLFLLMCVSFFVFFGPNPFERLGFFTDQGAELNPLLQDGSLMIHPPLLYLGYVGFSLVFSRTVGALMDREPLNSWRHGVLPWVLIPLFFLTLGVALGAFWAYYELGWGGYWFWDPVENVSLLPWLSGLALIHGLFLTRVGYGTVFMALITFMFSVLGTFLVRSGALSSVHSFASNMGRAIPFGIFLIILIALGAAGMMYHKSGYQSEKTKPGVVTRHMVLLKIGVVFLLSLLGTTVLGTVYPVIAAFFNQGPITVGAPYFHRTFLPITFFALIFLTFSFYGRGRRFIFNLSTLAVVTGGAIFLYGMEWISGPFSIRDFAFISLGIFMVLSYGLAVKQRGGHIGAVSFALKHMAHLGVIILTLGVSMDHFGGREEMIALKIGDTDTAEGCRFTLKDVLFIPHPTYVAERAILGIDSSQNHDAVNIPLIYPEKRLYMGHNVLTTETALYHHGLADWSVVFGGVISGDRYTFRLIYHPFIQLIWMGAAMMAIGFLISAMARWRFGRGAIMIASAMIACLIMVSDGNATTYGESLNDPTLEQRAIGLYTRLKCPTCHGVSVHESAVAAARDVRRTVRSLLIQGYDDTSIMTALKKQYGPQISFNPPVNPVTWPLWVLPFLMIIGGGVWVFKSVQKNRIF